MRWVDDRERGATAVVIALMMVPMIGFAALAVDLGASRWDQQQLQNGADAAVLAIAYDCASGDCGDADETARLSVEGNKIDADAHVESIAFPSASSVTVRAATDRQHWFAPVLGISETHIAAEATAAWGAIVAAGTIPLTVSECAFDYRRLNRPGQYVHLILKQTPPDPDADPCDPNNPPHVMPGGFHWLDPTSGCNADTSSGAWYRGDPGALPPAECGVDELRSVLQSGEPILIPLFDETAGTGSQADYHIVGYAAVIVTAFCIQPTSLEWNLDAASSSRRRCSADYLWVDAYFVKYTQTGGRSGNGNDYGASTVTLTD